MKIAAQCHLKMFYFVTDNQFGKRLSMEGFRIVFNVVHITTAGLLLLLLLLLFYHFSFHFGLGIIVGGKDVEVPHPKECYPGL